MNRNFIIGGIGIVVIIVGAILLNISGRNVGTKTGTSDFDRFAALVFVDYNGDKVSLEKFQGKPLVINSWAVWCPFCVKELPDFAELQREFDDEIIVIAIDRQEPLKKTKEFTDELGITDDMLFLLDASDSFYKSIGGFSMPETIFVDTNGHIVFHKRGPLTLEEMREAVTVYLQ